jgi:hypothetical protein
MNYQLYPIRANLTTDPSKLMPINPRTNAFCAIIMRHKRQAAQN